MLQSGFTLMELVIVIVALGILSAYAIVKSVSVPDATLLSQAEKMANDIRHAQTLAYTSGKSLKLVIATGVNGAYSVCLSTTTTCNASSAVTDTATGSSFSVSLQKGVSLSGTATLNFDSWGQPGAAASYTLSIPPSTSGETICVAALTGQISVQTSTTCS